MILFDPGFTVSDIIRFNPAGTGSPGYPASAVFYSLAGDGSLADTGFPASLYTNNVSFAEVVLSPGVTGLIYTPTSTQPGFVSGFAVVYEFISDSVPPVPEPGTVSLIALGGGLLIAGRRRGRAGR